MIDKRIIAKKMMFQGEGKTGERDIDLVDGGGEHVQNMFKVKAADGDILQHVDVIIPEKEFTF